MNVFFRIQSVYKNDIFIVINLLNSTLNFFKLILIFFINIQSHLLKPIYQ